MKGGKIIKTDIYKKIDKHVQENDEEIINVLQELVRVPSVNPWFKKDSKLNKEKECQYMLKDKLEKLGADTKIWEPNPEELKKFKNYPGYHPNRNFKNRPNLSAKFSGKGNGRSILLFGHIDVVDVEGGWAEPPFSAKIKNGKIYGRGTADMKAGLVTMLMAVKTIKNLNINLSGDVIFGSVVDEEAGGMGTLDYIENGLLADAGILAEPTDLKIAPLCRGILWGKIKISGRSGHIEIDHPHWENGGAVDAIEKSKYILDQIERLNKDWNKRKKHPLLPIPCQMIPAEINGGDYPTTYANGVEIVFNAQYLPGEKDKFGLGSKVKKEIEHYFEKVFKTDSWLSKNPPEIEWILDADCGEIPADHNLVKIMKNNHKRFTKSHHKIIEGVTTHTDMGLLIRSGVDTLNFGPGKPRVAHQTDEFIDKDDLLSATKIIAKTIVDWCGIEA